MAQILMKKAGFNLLTILLVTLLFLGAQAQKKTVWDASASTPVATFVGNVSSDYGSVVDVSSEHLIVGAEGVGKAYIYKRLAGSEEWDTTAPVATFSSSATGSKFGASVALGAKYAIVGDPASQEVSIFSMTDGKTWSAYSTILISGYKDQTNFGCSVDITDYYAIIGASGADKAYIFENSYSSGWSQDAAVILDYSNEGGSLDFGYSVAMTDTYALVGAPGTEKAYIFAKPILFGASFPTKADYILKDYEGFGYTVGSFGASVAITNLHAIIGASLAQKAFFFSRKNAQTTLGGVGGWPEAPTATIDAYSTEGGFGSAVALTA